MAGEEIFTANALISIAGMGVFMFLFYLAYKKNDEVMKYVWLSGVLLVMTYALTVQRVGFNVTGLYDLRDMAFTVLDILMYAFLALFFFTAAIIINLLAHAMMRVIKGEPERGAR